jgi:hypothetical protein
LRKSWSFTGIFGIGMIPESIVGWIVLEMIEIIGSLHRVGIAHNRLGLESFLVASDGTKWKLLLNGLGSKSSVQSGDDLIMHLRHDMLSLAFITWSILMGCSVFKYKIDHGEIQLEGSSTTLRRTFSLRGRDGWKELFSALLNCRDIQYVDLIPKATLASIRSILKMSHSSEDETTGERAVAEFFGSLMEMQLKAGGTITDIQFSKALGISSEELIFKLHFSKSSPNAFVANEDSLSEQCMHTSVKSLNSTKEFSQSEVPTAKTINVTKTLDAQCRCSNSLTVGPTAAEMSEMMAERQRSLEVLESRRPKRVKPQGDRMREPFMPVKAPTVTHSNDTGSVLPIQQRHSEGSEFVGGCTVSDSISTSEPPLKRRKMSTGQAMASLSSVKSRGPFESQSTTDSSAGNYKAPVGGARVVEFIPAKSRKRKIAKVAQDTVRRRSSRAQLVCGIEGCKNQFPVDNGYMWVMMVGLEDQADNTSLPIVPTYHPMHLVCTSCRDPKGDGMFLPNELLNEQDKREISHWDKYLYYKASRVEYEKWLRK